MTHGTELPLADQIHVDSVCDEFEGAWKSGARPELSRFLGRANENNRSFLWSQLLRLDVSYRRKAGQRPSLRDYSSSIPGLEPLLQAFEAEPVASSTGRYRLVAAHAKGGLGLVSRAIDTELNREVAYKELKPERAGDPAVAARFLREAQITGGLEHPGIVPVYSLGQDELGRPFYAMRFVRGESLSEAIGTLYGVEPSVHPVGTPLDDSSTAAVAPTVSQMADSSVASAESAPMHVPIALPLARPVRAVDYTSVGFRQLLNRFVTVCQAMDYAHSRGVLHRDLKPANIMLGEYGETLIVDWGLAKMQGAREPGAAEGAILFRPAQDDFAQTSAGMIAGTPPYMSPEQATGGLENLSPAADIYSLGATLYQLLTGRPPVDGSSMVEVLQRVQCADYRRPREIQARIPQGLEAICLKAMAPRPAERYATARALADDIEHWLADEPLAAHAERWHERMARWGRRHRSWVRAAACALAAVAIVSATALVLVNAARRQAEDDRDIAQTALAAEAAAKRAVEEANVQIEKEQALTQEALTAEQAAEAQAREAVDTYVQAVLDDDLVRGAGFQPLRRRPLKNALAYYNRLVEQSRGNSETDHELAAALERIAMIDRDTGSLPEAIEAWEQSRDAYRRLTQRFPGDADLENHLASTVNNLGMALAMSGDARQAIELYTQAREMFTELLSSDPGSADLRVKLANTINNIGTASGDVGDIEFERECFEQALLMRRQLAEEHPRSDDYQSLVASACFNLGALEDEAGNLEAAEKYLLESDDLYQVLTKEHPEAGDYRLRGAQCRASLGNLYMVMGRADDALAAHQEAMVIFDALAAENVHAVEYQSESARSRENLAIVYDATGRHDEALDSFAQAVAIWSRLVDEHGEMADYKNMLARCLGNRTASKLNAGDFPGAADDSQRALALARAVVEATPQQIAYRESLAAACLNAGLAQRAVGDLANALRSLDEGKQVASEAAALAPEQLDFLYILSQILHQSSVTRDAAGDPSAALDALREAVSVERRLVELAPRDKRYRAALGASCNNLSVFLGRANQPEAALAARREGLAIFSELVQETGGEAQWRRELARCLNGVALLEQAMGRLDAAIAGFEEAIGVLESLVRDAPSTPEYRAGLAGTRLNLGGLYSHLERPADAEACLRQGAELAAALADEFPGSTEFEYIAAAASFNLGEVLYRQLQRPDDALAAYELAGHRARQGLAVAPSSRETLELLKLYLRCVSEVCRDLGRLEQAATASIERRGLCAGSADDLYGIAAELANCAALLDAPRPELSAEDVSRRQRFADAAVETLREAAAAGFSDWQRLQADQAFAAIRDHAGLKELLEGLP